MPSLGQDEQRSDEACVPTSTQLGLGLGLSLYTSSSSASSSDVATDLRVLRSSRQMNSGGLGGQIIARVGVDVESPKGSPGRTAPFMPTRKRSQRLATKSSSGADELTDDARSPALIQARSVSNITSTSSASEPLNAYSYEDVASYLSAGNSARPNGPSPSSGAHARVQADNAFEATAIAPSRQLRRTRAPERQPTPRSMSPTRPPSPVKEASARLGGTAGPVPRPRAVANAPRGRPLSMYDAPISDIAPFTASVVSSSAGAAVQDTLAKKRKQLADAKRLKDARNGTLVASVAFAGSTPPRMKIMGAQRRAADRLHSASTSSLRTAPPEPDGPQLSVLDSIVLPIMDGDEEGDTSFVYEGDKNDMDDSDPFKAAPSDAQHVQVHVRIRPPREDDDDDLAWDAQETSRCISLAPSLAQARIGVTTTSFSFDGVHTASANKSIYLSVARPLVKSVLDGYDAVVFAYGQTGSGKTWTLSGDNEGFEPGIMPRAIKDIFSGIRQASSTREYLIRISYLESYNEQVKDLLLPSNLPHVRDESRNGRRVTVVKPLQEEVVTTPAQVMALLALGQANRHVGATDWNERSSRSHTVFKMTIESWERVSDEPWATEEDPERVPGSPAKQRTKGRTVRISELSMIDLAGSERYFSKGGSTARTEGSAINKSLLCLGRVIAALSEAKEGQHVPFRDSKLTRILQNSLSGNARVAVVCTLNPSSTAVEESLSTLSFARRVKKVALHAERNEIDAAATLGTEAQALIQRYRAEAESLRKQVRELEARATQHEQDSMAIPHADQEQIQDLRQRLEQIGSLIMVGGDEGDDEDEEQELDGQQSPLKRPMSPTKRGFRFDEAVPALQEKLFHANTRIRELESLLARRRSLPSATGEAAESNKDALIAQLKKQVHELELVCEAQAAQGPLPNLPEDVEREWRKKVEGLQAELGKRDRYILDLSRECHSLRNTNRQLLRVAHLDASHAVLRMSASGGGSTLAGSASAMTTPPPPPPPSAGAAPGTTAVAQHARPGRRSVSLMNLNFDESRLL